MPKKTNLKKCWPCREGYDVCKPGKLPRKNKKKFKALLLRFRDIMYKDVWDEFSSCSFHSDYKHWRGLVQKMTLFIKYEKELRYLKKYFDGEGIFLDKNGRLSWYWEYDSDYGGNSGVMPFCYSEEAAGNTWAFSEVCNIVFSLWSENSDIEIFEPDDFVFPENIKSDADLLRYVRSVLKN